MSILGLHHITLVCSDLERTSDYYTRVLGLSLVRPTQDKSESGHQHLYFGSPQATPGSLISFLEQPGATAGHEGVGGTHHFALLLESRQILLKWKRRLNDLGIPVSGPLDRHYFESIYHRDPDGTVIEIATRGVGWTRDEAADRIGTEHRAPPPEMLTGNRDKARIQAETWPEPVSDISGDMRFSTLHHITAIGTDIERTHEFLHGVLGLRRVKQTSNFDMPDSLHWYWGAGKGDPGSVVTYFERRGADRVVHGPGQVDHYSLAVVDEHALTDWRARVTAAGFPASPVTDQIYFKSFVTRDPDGQTVELATQGPGFGLVDTQEEK
jgi:glyoxalase family protein